MPVHFDVALTDTAVRCPVAKCVCCTPQARAFPSEHYAETPHLHRHGPAVFYRLLRPELLRYLRTQTSLPPLNPDALTLWGRLGSEEARARHDRDLRDATRRLVTQVVPRFALWFRNWSQRASKRERHKFQFAEEMHRRGTGSVVLLRCIMIMTYSFLFCWLPFPFFLCGFLPFFFFYSLFCFLLTSATDVELVTHL